jgi:threonylcarbamoyladenosine tRNA methylthiotransferase MtaB
MSSVEPHTTEAEVVDLMAAPGSKLCRTLHYPLQSGSDRVLRAMRRRYTAAEYRAAVERALALVPRLGLGADVIAGFPGETDADFEETVRLVRDYPFSNLHVFPYSERPGTPAATMPGAVPVRVRRERARALAALGEEKRAAFAASFAGAEAEVLVERVGPDGTAEGWTSEYLRARIPGRSPADAGALLRVRVLRAEGDLLHADAAASPQPLAAAGGER